MSQEHYERFREQVSLYERLLTAEGGVIMSLSAKQKKDGYTYADYLKWPQEERWEIINGVAYDMSPAPSRRHQEIAVELIRQFANFLVDKPCRVYGAPFDVVFPQGSGDEKEIDSVVQPDVLVVCDKTKLTERGCEGAPDLIIEILSTSTVQKDIREKFLLYEKEGVKEYWIIHPSDQTVLVFKQNDGRYGKPDMYSGQNEISVNLLEGLTIYLKYVFQD